MTIERQQNGAPPAVAHTRSVNRSGGRTPRTCFRRSSTKTLESRSYQSTDTHSIRARGRPPRPDRDEGSARLGTSRSPSGRRGPTTWPRLRKSSPCGLAEFRPVRSPEHGQRVAAYYWWVFPNLMLNFYPWGLSLNLVQPEAVDRTRVAFRTYVWDSNKTESGAGAALHQVEMEDEAIVQSVQRGTHSRLYHKGRYSPTREQGTHHFHRLLCEFMYQNDAVASAGTMMETGES